MSGAAGPGPGRRSIPFHRHGPGKTQAMAGRINLTTDHDEIRRWVEGVGGQPVRVRSTYRKLVQR